MRAETKLFEIRDAGTFIPVAATRVINGGDATSWLVSRGGWALGDGPTHVWRLSENVGYSDPLDWGGQSRTMQVAHQHIIEAWDSLESGAVIDVEFLLGMRAEPKLSERVTERGFG